VLAADPQIHEPKGVASAATGTVYTANGVGSGSWAALPTADPRFDPSELVVETLISAQSVAASQEPSAVDTPIQLEFGPAINTGSDDIQLLADGTLQVNVAGTYHIDIVGQYGRTSGAGTSIILVRSLVNGTQVSAASIAAKIDDADTLMPYETRSWATLPAGTLLTYELVRDSAGNNSGGLFRTAPTLGGWAPAPSISITVTRFT